MSYTTGRRYEQELVNRFHAAGWGALRLGASGGGGDADLPDVFAGKPSPPNARGNQVTNLIAVELKSGKASTLYVDAAEVDALERFASDWGARPMLAARSTRQGTATDTYLVPPERARRTESGSFGLPIPELESRAEIIVGDNSINWVK